MLLLSLCTVAISGHGVPIVLIVGVVGEKVWCRLLVHINWYNRPQTSPKYPIPMTLHQQHTIRLWFGWPCDDWWFCSSGLCYHWFVYVSITILLLIRVWLYRILGTYLVVAMAGMWQCDMNCNVVLGDKTIPDEQVVSCYEHKHNSITYSVRFN